MNIKMDAWHTLSALKTCKSTGFSSPGQIPIEINGVRFNAAFLQGWRDSIQLSIRRMLPYDVTYNQYFIPYFKRGAV